MHYAHHWVDGTPIDLPMGKIVCVGRNYAEHARELDNPVPDEPLLFIKPGSCAVDFGQPIRIPGHRGPVHFETEIALLVDGSGIAGLGLALDLTLRSLQSELKARGHPWEKAKAFDGSAPMTAFVPNDQVAALNEVRFQCTINGQRRQLGNSSDMLFPIPRLMAYIGDWFTLQPGDVVLTGTPAGVGVLAPGDAVELQLEDWPAWTTTVRENEPTR